MIPANVQVSKIITDCKTDLNLKSWMNRLSKRSRVSRKDQDSGLPRSKAKNISCEFRFSIPETERLFKYLEGVGCGRYLPMPNEFEWASGVSETELGEAVMSAFSPTRAIIASGPAAVSAPVSAFIVPTAVPAESEASASYIVKNVNRARMVYESVCVEITYPNDITKEELTTKVLGALVSLSLQ